MHFIVTGLEINETIRTLAVDIKYRLIVSIANHNLYVSSIGGAITDLLAKIHIQWEFAALLFDNRSLFTTNPTGNISRTVVILKPPSLDRWLSSNGLY